MTDTIKIAWCYHWTGKVRENLEMIRENIEIIRESQGESWNDQGKSRKILK